MSKIARLFLIAMAVFAVAASGAVAGGSSEKSAASTSGTTIKVALMLPDSKTARYDTKDRPYFEAKMKQICPQCEVIYNNANGDPTAQLNAAEAALTNGAKVLVIMAVDTTSSAAIADKAQAQGVPVIAYSRLIEGSTGVTYSVLFDNRQIGVLQAQGLLKGLAALKAAHPSMTTDPKIVMINGSPTDSNAALFKKGAHGVFDPLVQEGKLTIAKEYDTPDWSPDKAQTEMQQALTTLGNQVDGVYAANDGTASGAVAAMQAANVSPWPPVTGLDAELSAVQRILVGKQFMTVYLPLRPLAENAAQLAYDLATNTTVPASLTNGQTVNNGVKDVPVVRIAPAAVYKETIKKELIDGGFWTVKQVCTPEYAAPCKSVGIE